MNDKPGLRHGTAVGETLRAVAGDILADARMALEDPAHSDADAVHAFRRTMKRWRALLRLLDPFLGADGRTLRAQARDLARALAGARDAQSALDALADLTKHGIDLSPRTLATLRERLQQIRTAAESQILTGDMRLRMTDALDQAIAAVRHWPVDDLAFDALAGRLARAFRSARRAVPDDWAEAAPEELHDLRKRVVNHRYQMEVVEPLWPRFARMWIGEAQRLRDRLGKHQDLLVLARFTEPHQPLARWRVRLAPAIVARRHEHARAARRIALRLFAEKPKALRRRLETMWEAGA